MYKILTESNALLGYVDSPNYVRLKDGSPVPCAPVEGRGLTFQGRVYSLPGHRDFDGPVAYASRMTDAETSAVVQSLNALLGDE